MWSLITGFWECQKDSIGGKGGCPLGGGLFITGFSASLPEDMACLWHVGILAETDVDMAVQHGIKMIGKSEKVAFTDLPPSSPPVLIDTLKMRFAFLCTSLIPIQSLSPVMLKIKVRFGPKEGSGLLSPEITFRGLS